MPTLCSQRAVSASVVTEAAREPRSRARAHACATATPAPPMPPSSISSTMKASTCTSKGPRALADKTPPYCLLRATSNRTGVVQLKSRSSRLSRANRTQCFRLPVLPLLRKKTLHPPRAAKSLPKRRSRAWVTRLQAGPVRVLLQWTGLRPPQSPARKRKVTRRVTFLEKKMGRPIIIATRTRGRPPRRSALRPLSLIRSSKSRIVGP